MAQSDPNSTKTSTHKKTANKATMAAKETEEIEQISSETDEFEDIADTTSEDDVKRRKRRGSKKMNEKVRALIRLAKEQGHVTYKEINKALGETCQ